MSRQKYKQNLSELQGWEMAIAQTEKQLRESRSKVARLMASLQTFKEGKISGKPWPGDEKAGTAKEAIPA
ncbi:MAG: hypothetical protein LAP21_05950 [Acidobacteriia bacterium]|nr:hypothetical protein [Terriglobia bacterium]